MADGPLLIFVFIGVILLYVVAKSLHAESKFRHIPAIGPTGPLASYWGVLRYILRCREVTIEGYKKYPDGIFRVPLLQEWLVFCSGQNLLEEIRKASVSELSIHDAIDDILQTPYTLDQAVRDNDYHVGVIRHTLPRSLAACFPDIRDEVQQAFEDNLALGGNEWKSVHAMTLILSVVCRTTNRLIVGLPLCRDPEYLKINTEFTIDVFMVSNFLRLVPRSLRPIVGKLVSKLDKYKKRTHKLVAGMINERLNMEEQYGKDWPGKPNDMLSWFIDKAPPHLCTVDDLILRILNTNFGAIHTSSLNFAHALYHLAAEPEHAAVLRKEVDAIIEEDGWTKAAIDRMIKVDSFLRESQRVNGISTFNMSRVTVKDFTFSNGIVVPARTTIAIPMYPMHHDEAIWPDPYKFDPYRSSRVREKDAGDIKQQLVTPSPEFLPWGYGKHACPGRFFANSEMKAMLAHVVHAYDVKFEAEGVRPPNLWIVGLCMPNRNAKVMFRRRIIKQ